MPHYTAQTPMPPTISYYVGALIGNCGLQRDFIRLVCLTASIVQLLIHGNFYPFLSAKF